MGSIEALGDGFSVANVEILNPKPTGDSIRSIPDLIEYNAKHNGDLTFCVQALKTSQGSYDLQKVSFGVLKQAVLRCSDWLLENVKEIKLPTVVDNQLFKGHPVAILAESDFGILLHLFSLLHLGVPVVLLSARLSPKALQHVLEKTSATAIVTSQRLRVLVQQAGITIPTYQQTPFLDFLSGGKSQQSSSFVGLPHHYHDDEDRQVIIFHSSGSTGLPKPIYHGHRYLLGFTKAHLFQSPQEAQSLTISTLPLYHAYGFVTPALALGVGQPFCLPPSSIVPNAASTVDLLRFTGAGSLITVPSILEDIAELSDGKGISTLMPLHFVAFGGGPLKAAIADKLEAGGVKLLNHYGATEVGPIAPIYRPSKGISWRSFRLRTDMGLRVDPAVVNDAGVQQFSLTAYPFGWGTTFTLQDLLEEDLSGPSRSFINRGRTDDVIPLATGEKANPRILESLLEELAEVKSAIAFGESQFELGVMIEPATTGNVERNPAYLSRIWSTIQIANEQMDTHARISSPDSVLIIPSDKLLPRSDKGSVMRKQAYEVFHVEIENVYQKLEQNACGDTVKPLIMDRLEEGITEIVVQGLGFKGPEGKLGLTDDLFELGFDSLQALRLRRYLISAMPKSHATLPRDFVYQNPSISLLAQSLSNHGASAETQNASDEVDSYIQNFAYKRPTERLSTSNNVVVLVTGGTGSLGAHLLACLASLSHVTRVICLNRRAVRQTQVNSIQRQREAFARRLIKFPGNLWRKLEVLECDTSRSHLGLNEAKYKDLCRNVTHILHNAWPLNFKWALRSFEGQFVALQNLIQLARDVHSHQTFCKPQFLFVSSIAVVGRYPAISGEKLIPETALVDSRSTNEFGYGRAKFVCEKILQNACDQYKGEFDAASVRIGQMAAAKSTGYWSHTEHIAALIRSSQSVGAFPLLKGTASWLPVDTTAQVLTEILLGKQLPGSTLHLENPIRQSWHDITQVLMTNIGLAEGKTIPYSSWIKRVSDLPDTSLDNNPAHKILEFFQEDFEHMACGSVVLDTSLSRLSSPALRGSDIMSEAEIVAFLNHWKREGVIS